MTGIPQSLPRDGARSSGRSRNVGWAAVEAQPPASTMAAVPPTDRWQSQRPLSTRGVGLQAGLPATRRDAQGEWRTAIGKQPVRMARIGAEGLAGDAVADTQHHGGAEKAVLAYAAGHYPAWEREWARRLPFGAFGENFTLEGGDESSVCIGDVWAVGQARLQISQPREPCYKPGRYWQLPEVMERMIATRRTGWYLRVLTPGEAAAGAEMTLVERAWPEWTVARALAIFYAREYPNRVEPAAGALTADPGNADPDVTALASDAAALAGCPALSPRWRSRLASSGG